MSLAGYNKITEKLPKNGFCEFIKRPAVVGVPSTACIVVGSPFLVSSSHIKSALISIIEKREPDTEEIIDPRHKQAGWNVTDRIQVIEEFDK